MTELRVQIDWLGGNCPVQAEGNINGHPFYFRARGHAWTLEITPYIGDPWTYIEAYGTEPFAAGWMDESEANDLIFRAAHKWLSERG